MHKYPPLQGDAMKLGIIELWRQNRELGDEGLEELAKVILNYDTLGRIFDSHEILGRRPEDIGAVLDRDWIFNFQYNGNCPDANPNIPALLAVKESMSIDVLCVVSKSQYLCFAHPYNITGSPAGIGYQEIGIAFANLLYIEKGIDVNNLIVHEIGHTLGLKEYPLCGPSPNCWCEYSGHIMCPEDNSKGLHKMDIEKLSHLLK